MAAGAITQRIKFKKKKLKKKIIFFSFSFDNASDGDGPFNAITIQVQSIGRSYISFRCRLLKCVSAL